MLQLLLAGLQDIDVNDWKRHTKYRGEYNPNHPVIINFWKVRLLNFYAELKTGFVYGLGL